MTLPNHLTHTNTGYHAGPWYQTEGQPTVYFTAEYAAQMETRSAPSPDPFEGYDRHKLVVASAPARDRVTSRKMRTLHTCPECDRAYYQSSPSQKYCCLSCTRAAWQRSPAAQRTCPCCGSDFTLREPTDNRKYCSNACVGKARRKTAA